MIKTASDSIKSSRLFIESVASTYLIIRKKKLKNIDNKPECPCKEDSCDCSSPDPNRT